MLKHVTFLGASAVAACLSTGAFAQDVTADTVVVTVGDTEITMGELIVARTQLPPQYAQFPNDVLFDGLVDQLVQQQLLADEMETVTPKVTYTLANERRALLANEVITGIVESSVSDADIQEAYDARFADVEELSEFNASHLLVETEEEAAAAKARIDDGQAFADVARDVSTGPTGPNGGDLGWFGPGAMVPEFEEQVSALEISGVTDPFETQFGWHVATLNEIRVQPRPTLEELDRELRSELQEQAVTRYLAELAEATTVVKPEDGQFDPALLDNLDLLNQ